MTLFQLTNLIKGIANTHAMIKTFGEGDIYDYVDNGGEIVYPVLWLLNEPSNYNKSVMAYNVRFICADLLVEDKSNRLQLQSDQLQVALDVIAKMKLDKNYFFNISDNVQVDYFQERFDDFTAGVSVAFTISTPTPLDYCSFPT